MRVIFNSKPGRELSQFKKRLWNFDVTHLPWSFGNVQSRRLVYCVCSQLWLKNSNFSLLATSRGPLQASKNSKQKLHIQNRKNPRNCYTTSSSPPLVWFFVSVLFLSYHQFDLYYKIFSWVKKTGCRRRNVLKEDLVAEDKTRKLVSSLWARLPGYGQKRPRYQWVPGYQMVWDMENLV